MIQSPAAVYADLIVPAKTGEFWRAPETLADGISEMHRLHSISFHPAPLFERTRETLLLERIVQLGTKPEKLVV